MLQITLFTFYVLFGSYAYAEELVLDAIRLRTLISQVQRNQTLIVKLDNMAYLETHEFDFNEHVSTWVLATQNTTTIYENGELKQDKNFECIPSTASCNSLLIRDVTKSNIGQYVKVGKSDDRSKFTFTSYTLTAMEEPKHDYCAIEPKNCQFDNKTNVISVKEGVNVSMVCSYYIWQAADDKLDNLPVEIDFPYEFGIDCNRKQVTKFIAYIDSKTNSKRVVVSKECMHAFDKHEIKFSCVLVNTNDRHQNDHIIDRSEVRLDVHHEAVKSLEHEPEHLNKTVYIGEQVSLTCPFEGNPIRYVWKNVTATTNSSEFDGDKVQTLSLLKSIGLHEFECRAYVGGLLNKWSEPVKFSVNVQQLVVPPKKGVDKSFWINIIIGCIAVFFAIILCVIVFYKVLRVRGKADITQSKPHEVEPLKEIEKK